MRKAILIAALFFSSICLHAQTWRDSVETSFADAADDAKLAGLTKLDTKYGFRDLKFGTTVASVKGLALLESKGGMRVYTRVTDSKKVGNFQVSRILYYFYRGQLSSIRLDTKGYLNSRGVLAAFQGLYGPGEQDNEYIEEYSWVGDRVVMNYEENSVSNNATIYLFSRSMLERQRVDEEKAAQKAGADL
ncbi:hypothetical protein GCM10027048_20010 [Hymenobacter coalescens]